MSFEGCRTLVHMPEDLEELHHFDTLVNSLDLGEDGKWLYST